MDSETVDHHAKIIWDYMLIHHELQPADAIVALGTSDSRVAARAADIYHAGYASLVITSGYRPASSVSTKTEAEIFADVLMARGVPKEKILIEPRASNTEENIRFVRNLLQEKSVEVNTLIAVQKPYMERRTWATLQKVWPEVQWMVTSPQLSYEEYMETGDQPKQWFIESVVGDLQRIKEYPKRGFSIEQDIPSNVWEAWEELVKLGYTRRLLQ